MRADGVALQLTEFGIHRGVLRCLRLRGNVSHTPQRGPRGGFKAFILGKFGAPKGERPTGSTRHYLRAFEPYLHAQPSDAGGRDFPVRALNGVLHGALHGALNGTLNEASIRILIKPRTDRVETQDPVAFPESAVFSKIELLASGIANLTQTRGIGQLVRPSMYRMTQYQSIGQEYRPLAHHALTGTSHLKIWLKSQTAQARFGWTASNSPETAGAPLAVRARPGSGEVLVFQPIASTPPEFRKIARSGLDLLTQLAAHGLIHGDLKPQNLLYDPREARLQALVTRSMHQVSRRSESRGHWSGKASSNASAFSRPGPGSDLYAFGVTLLLLSLTGSGASESDRHEMLALVSDRISLEAELRCRHYPVESPTGFAKTCILAALEEERGLHPQDLSQTRALLNRLARHAALVPAREEPA